MVQPSPACGVDPTHYPNAFDRSGVHLLGRTHTVVAHRAAVQHSDGIGVCEELALSTFTVDEAVGLLTDPSAFTDEARVHAGLSYLRANAPVVRVDHAPYRPFWAVTRHADIVDIERNHALWINGKGSLLTTIAIDASLRAQNDDGMAMRTMNQMDGQHHRALRAIAADWFRPKAMRALSARVDELARNYVDHMLEIGPECDFVTEVAVNYPGYVILSLMGLPEDDYPLIQRLTNELRKGRPRISPRLGIRRRARRRRRSPMPASTAGICRIPT
jgi:cytochrome P450